VRAESAEFLKSRHERKPPDAAPNPYEVWQTEHGLTVYRELARLLTEKKSKSILDVACGDGAVARACSEHERSILGVDIAETSIKSGHEQGLPGTTFTQGEFPFSDAFLKTLPQIDTIVSTFFLHLPNDSLRVKNGVVQLLRRSHFGAFIVPAPWRLGQDKQTQAFEYCTKALNKDVDWNKIPLGNPDFKDLSRLREQWSPELTIEEHKIDVIFDGRPEELLSVFTCSMYQFRTLSTLQKTETVARVFRALCEVSVNETVRIKRPVSILEVRRKA
jgi:SAM-dependent methyltransferase